MKLHYLAIIAVTSIAANIGTVSAAVSIDDYIGRLLIWCSFSLTYISIAHLTTLSHTFFNEIQSIRGIATSDSEGTNPVLVKLKPDESDLRKVEIDEGDEDEYSWDEAEDSWDWDYPDDGIDEDEEDPDNAELALFGNEFMSEGRGGRFVGNNRNNFRRRRDFRGSRNFRRNDFRGSRNFRRNDFGRGRDFSRNSNRFCREMYGRNFRYSSLGDCIRRN